jgi:hypothetical protein
MFGRPHKGHSTRKVIECAHFAAIPTDRRLSHSRFNAVLKYTVGLGRGAEVAQAMGGRPAFNGQAKLSS